MTNVLKKHPELEDLLGKGVRARAPEMPYYEARTFMFGERWDGLSLPELQQHLARAQAYDTVEAYMRRGTAPFPQGTPRGTPPIDLGHGERAAQYDAGILANELQAEINARAKAQVKAAQHNAELNKPGTIEHLLYPYLQRLDLTVSNNIKTALGISGAAGGGLTAGLASALLAHHLVNQGAIPGGEGGVGTTFGAALVGGLGGAAMTGLGGEHLGQAAAQGFAARARARQERIEN